MKKQTISSLDAISPLDGRYADKTQPLRPYFSEASLIKARVAVEAAYLVALSENHIARSFTKSEKTVLYDLSHLTDKQLLRMKELEQTTRHDVKAIEYWMRETLKKTTLKDTLEMIHFGLTSEDINNLAYRLILKRSVTEIFIPQLQILITSIAKKADATKSLPMLARTHGQPAIPTTFGKELVNFAVRLHKEVKQLEHIPFSGKLNGAVGNFNALALAFPNTNWIDFSETFITSLGLSPNLYTTQINTSEDIIALLQIFSRVNGILLDFDQDMWRYISDGWLVQQVKKGEIGSSTMPQKVNPIDFENSEGNIKIGTSLLDGITHSLAVSRLQRDLSGSTILRNLGTALSYTYLAMASTQTGIERIEPNKEKMTADLLHNWSILTEAVQTILRKEGVTNAYDMVKNFTHGKELTEKNWQELIGQIPIKPATKKQLFELTPQTYLGKAVELTDMAIKELKIKP